MAEILPFIGTRYNSQLIGNLAKVLAPPYDVITPEMQDALYERHEYNVVRLELTKDQPEDDEFSNRYTRAANSLKTWRSDGILIEEEKPALYLYEQEFKTPDGETKKRRGFFALVKLEEPGNGRGRMPQEDLVGHKADRLQLLNTTHANVSPVFAVYNDPEQKVLELLCGRMTDRPWEEVSDDDGVVHRIWVVQKKEYIVAVQEAMKNRKLFIADGQHRYESALAFRDQMRARTGKANGKQPFDYLMMYIASAEQDGLVVVPTHRVLAKSLVKEINVPEALEELEENFEIEQDKVDLDKPAEEACRVLEKVQKLGKDVPAMAMALADGRLFYLTLREDVEVDDLIDDDSLETESKRLDVSILHHYIINQVMVGNPEFELEEDECLYVRDPRRVLELLKSKKGLMAFLLRSIPVDQAMNFIQSGVRMPRKSITFHPKVISGLVIRNMDCESKKPQPAVKKSARA